ncbi:hypothetical protein COMA2_50046 [Candidatus Nitrospira nitrificans]|uniref:Uncharacterized protein n=1 Tax=Candidatus Nitrospira nitrificans TaxID=1742973 RepID=A0A0S4LN34_9BACT|nr:hypothetical protein COMA2_50046 [Candidatus Nitrospira nitrificans]
MSDDRFAIPNYSSTALQGWFLSFIERYPPKQTSFTGGLRSSLAPQSCLTSPLRFVGNRQSHLKREAWRWLSAVAQPALMVRMADQSERDRSMFAYGVI